MMKVQFSAENELIQLPMEHTYTNGVKTAQRIRIRRIKSQTSQALPSLTAQKKRKLKIKAIVNRLRSKSTKFVPHACSNVTSKEQCFHCKVETALYGSPEKPKLQKKQRLWRKMLSL